ncbi:2TM domain-containing protein [Hymenobacter rubidus]|uniref:2TM domain-containing protein n=1 Tax=Hymenobacter rubidus TaxID=1441626 RepID=UPI00191CD70A|nr:2TM domain-containing protein [Hymenobacter rubidus]
MEPLQRDPYLWQKAKARAKFQAHLVTYLVVNAGLWVIWALTDHRHEGEVPWPLWATAFWGFGLLMRGIAAYGGMSREQRTQREYERLVREEGTGADPLDRYR